jgi:hypothetical protein
MKKRILITVCGLLVLTALWAADRTAIVTQNTKATRQAWLEQLVINYDTNGSIASVALNWRQTASITNAMGDVETLSNWRGAITFTPAEVAAWPDSDFKTKVTARLDSADKWPEQVFVPAWKNGLPTAVTP